MSKDQFLAQYGDEKHIDHALKSKDDEVKYSVAHNPSLTHEHMKTIMDNKDEWGMHLGLSKNPATSKEHLETLSNHKDAEVVHQALLNKSVSAETIHKAINNPRLWNYTMEAIVKDSPHVTKEHLKQIVYAKNKVATNKTPYYNSDIKDVAQERLMREHGVD